MKQIKEYFSQSEKISSIYEYVSRSETISEYLLSKNKKIVEKYYVVLPYMQLYDKLKKMYEDEVICLKSFEYWILPCSKLIDAMNAINPTPSKRMGRIWEVPEKHDDIRLFKKEFEDEKIDPYLELKEIDAYDFYEKNS